ncbi:MAG TPA: hypothetical protein VI006_01975 [Solirubrobacteraceae bacterium]
MSALTRLDAGDAISVLAEQQSGGDLDVTFAKLTMRWVGLKP